FADLTALGELGFSEITDVVSSCYLRLPVRDQAGVMAEVSTILSNHGISIEALIQKDARRSDASATDAQIVIVTNEVTEAAMNAAIADLGQLDAVTHDVVRIRVNA
ncbi:MAG: ACT domain-containing protein, partial [Pseudomonadota bacterium]